MKYIVMILLVVLGVNANAQYTTGLAAPSTGFWTSKVLPYYTSGDDTATNTDVIRMGTYVNGKVDMQIKLVATKVSGTLSGTAYVRVSPDGTNWYSLAQGTQTYNDTLTVGDATTTHIWSFTGEEINAKYIEVYYSTSGTSVSAPVATVYYRKPE